MFARGCENSWVGDQGILGRMLNGTASAGKGNDVKTYVNIKCNGIPSFCAQWICA